MYIEMRGYILGWDGRHGNGNISCMKIKIKRSENVMRFNKIKRHV